MLRRAWLAADKNEEMILGQNRVNCCHVATIRGAPGVEMDSP